MPINQIFVKQIMYKIIYFLFDINWHLFYFFIETISRPKVVMLFNGHGVENGPLL